MFIKTKSFKESEDGFTLIELLIVVVIIGILAAIAIPVFLNQQKAAVVASMKSDVRNNIPEVQTYLTTHKNANPAELNIFSEPNSSAQTGSGATSLKLLKSDPNTQITVVGYRYDSAGAESAAGIGPVIAYYIGASNSKVNGGYAYYSGSKNIASQFTATPDLGS